MRKKKRNREENSYNCNIVAIKKWDEIKVGVKLCFIYFKSYFVETCLK